MKTSIGAYIMLLASCLDTTTAQLRLLRDDRRVQVRQARAESAKDGPKGKGKGPGDEILPLPSVEEPVAVLSEEDGPSLSMPQAEDAEFEWGTEFGVEDEQSLSMSISMSLPEFKGAENEFEFSLVAAGVEFSLSMSTPMSLNQEAAVPDFEHWEESTEFGGVASLSLSMSNTLEEEVETVSAVSPTKISSKAQKA